MGSDNSKTDRFIDDAEDLVQTLRNVLSNGNRRSTPSSQNTQPPRQQNTNRVPVTTQQRSNFSPPPQPPPPSLERARTPYNYTNRDLLSTAQTNSQSLYPNLDSVNRINELGTRSDGDYVVIQQYQQRMSPSAPSAADVMNLPETAPVPRAPVPKAPASNASAPKAPASNASASNAPASNASTSNASASKAPASNASAPKAPASNASTSKTPASNVSASNASAYNAPQPSQTTYRCGPSNPGPSNVSQPVLPKTEARSRSESRGRFIDPRLNCPTCTQRFGLTIYLCEKGHGSCKDCRENNRLCESDNGRCRAPITGLRNIALECYVAEYSRKQLPQCENERCTLRFDGPGMEKHLKECPFGEMDCPMGKFFGTCSHRCKVEDLAIHFDACHKEQRGAELDKEMFIFNLSIDGHKLYLIRNGPYNFLLHSKVSAKDARLYLAVQLIGSAVSSTKWTYEFHIYNKRQPHRKYLYGANCHPIGTPLNEILTDAKCAVLPTAYAMSFANESSLTYKFFIMKTGENRPRRRNIEWKRRNADK